MCLSFLRIALDRSDLTDEHVIEILRGKDHQLVELHHNNLHLSNQCKTMSDNLNDMKKHQEHLEEKVSMLTCLIEVNQFNFLLF